MIIKAVEEPEPSACDFCTQSFLSGSAYQRVEFVIDAGASFIGGRKETIEHSYPLVACLDCIRQLERIIFRGFPLDAIPVLVQRPEETEGGVSLPLPPPASASESEVELLDQLEVQNQILDPAEGIRAGLDREPGCCRCHRLRETGRVSERRICRRCEQCQQPVCSQCALAIPGRPLLELFRQTLCSKECWELIGRPLE